MCVPKDSALVEFKIYKVIIQLARSAVHSVVTRISEGLAAEACFPVSVSMTVDAFDVSD